jgi:hypothetical protein
LKWCIIVNESRFDAFCLIFRLLAHALEVLDGCYTTAWVNADEKVGLIEPRKIDLAFFLLTHSCATEQMRYKWRFEEWPNE